MCIQVWGGGGCCIGVYIQSVGEYIVGCVSSNECNECVDHVAGAVVWGAVIK
jgi:hypothetical protein